MKSENFLIDDFGGRIGALFFRSVGGKVYLSKSPIPPRSIRKKRQTAHTERFKRASQYASAQMKDAGSKAEYETATTRKKHTAFLVAMSDYLNAPVVHGIGVRDYGGKKGDPIIIRATDDFMIMGIQVTILGKSGEVLEEGQATPDLDNMYYWQYSSQSENRELAGTVIRATAFDKPGNATTKEIVL